MRKSGSGSTKFSCRSSIGAFKLQFKMVNATKGEEVSWQLHYSNDDLVYNLHRTPCTYQVTHVIIQESLYFRDEFIRQRSNPFSNNSCNLLQAFSSKYLFNLKERVIIITSANVTAVSGKVIKSKSRSLFLNLSFTKFWSNLGKYTIIS